MADVIAIRGGTVVDSTGTRVADVVVEDGFVKAVGEGVALDIPFTATVLDASGCLVAPGLVDLHTHLREPGKEEAETIESGSRAGALGGYTALVAMPNTDPTTDSAAVVRHVVEAGRKAGLCRVAPAAAITIGRAGTRLAPFAELAAIGVHIFTDDGAGVQDARLMRRALEYASVLDVTLAQHCEDESLSQGGHMHEGEWSSRLGIPGIPAEAEELMVMRDIALCRLTGARIHFLHLSTAGSVAMVRAAKAAGLPITAEATPHHLVLTHAQVASFDPAFKVNPPLRTAEDVAAVREGVIDGTCDAIATDHAPHPLEEKQRPFDHAPCGMLGLETALALVWTELVHPGLLSAEAALARMSWQPARIAGLDREGQGGPILPGAAAHLCVIDPEATWVVDPNRLASRSTNTPYAGRTLRGRARHTIFGGTVTVQDGEAIL